jgi:hypothetical protein
MPWLAARRRTRDDSRVDKPDSLRPRGEALRDAVRWLGQQGPVTLASIEAAARRFDLSPADEEFLLAEFRPDNEKHFKTKG